MDSEWKWATQFNASYEGSGDWQYGTGTQSSGAAGARYLDIALGMASGGGGGGLLLGDGTPQVTDSASPGKAVSIDVPEPWLHVRPAENTAQVSVAGQFGLGLVQGGLNGTNAVTNLATDAINTPLEIANLGLGLFGVSLPTIPRYDWSRGLAVDETDWTHNFSVGLFEASFELLDAARALKAAESAAKSAPKKGTSPRKWSKPAKGWASLTAFSTTSRRESTGSAAIVNPW